MEYAKATEYAVEPMVKLLRTEAISDGGTEKIAAAIEGTWVRVNETMFVLMEEGKVTMVYSDDTEVGCACGRASGVLCEHIIAFENLPEKPQMDISSPDCRNIQEYLFSLGWYTKNGYLHPSNDTPVVEPEKLDPANEDKPLDIGVDEPKMIERKCDWCGFVSKGYDAAEVKKRIADHRETCPKNPANKKKPPVVTQEEPEQPPKPVVKKPVTTEKPPVAKPTQVVKPQKKEEKKVKPSSKETGSLFDWIENLVEFGVCQIFGETGTSKTAVCRKLAEDSADEGKKVVYWDTEGNMTRKQRAAMSEHKNITYILDRDWEHIKNMLSSDLSKGSPKLGKCDLFILDSIGVPVLGIYGTLKQNEQGNALQSMQGLLYELTKFAETNDAVVIVTNQPVSEMNKTKEQKADRHPFGDKAMFFTKEILKIVAGERTEYKTVCHIMAWRSRSAGRGKMLCTVTVSDNGVEVTPI